MARRVELVLLHGSSASIPTHVQLVISSYLGPAPNVTLSETCSIGSIALLDWMWDASCTHASERTPWWSLTNFLRSEPHYYRYQFAESMAVAAQRGDLPVMKWLLENFQDCVAPGGALLWDYDDGRHDRERRDAKKRKVVTKSGETLSRGSAGKNVVCWEGFITPVRHLDVARWLHLHSLAKHDDKLDSAIRYSVDKDDWEIATFLLPPGRCLLDYGAYCANPKMITWMLGCGYLQRNSKVAVYAIRDLAARSANLPLMQRIADLHKPPYSPDWNEGWSQAMAYACASGQLQTLQWLAEHPTGVRICGEIRRREHERNVASKALDHVPADVGMLQYLYEQDLFVANEPKGVWLAAIYKGQPLEMLKWLLGHPPGSKRLPGYCLMDEAASNGRLEVLQYFQRLQLSAFSRNTFFHGDGDVPMWCSTQAMDGAAARGHLEVVKWLHENRPEGCTVAAMDGAASNGHLEVVKWLHTNRMEGCTVAAVDETASNGHLETLKWLQSNMIAECSTDAMDNAARGGHLETLKWLHGNTSKGCTGEAINNAMEFRHFRVASWLHAQFPEFIPAKMDGWLDDTIVFEELLFRQEHCGGVLTSDFLRRLRNPSRRSFSCEKGEVWSWVKEKYIG